MLVKYDTAALQAPGTKSGGYGGLIVGLLLLGAASWATYEFWWKPKQEKEKLAAKKA